VEQAAQILAAVGYVVCVLAMAAGLVLLVHERTPDAGRAAAVGIMAGGAVGILAARVQMGVVLVLVDIARSLRELRQRGLAK
jgi:hypothetical protein